MLIVGLFCLFAFGNPQWHKQIYMFQATWINYTRPDLNDNHDEWYRFPPPDNYEGIWRSYDSSGNVYSIHKLTKSQKPVVIFDSLSIDRRKEFGFDIE